MSEPFIGEIRLLPYGFTPQGYVECDGTLLRVSENAALFQLIGTTYGGDGETNFAVPDLRGRVPVHQGGTAEGSYVLGQVGGAETVTLVAAQLGPHTHAVQASTVAATATGAAGAVFAAIPAAQGGDTFYATTLATATAFAGTTVQLSGGGLPHDNTAPTIPLRYCIATDGLFPFE